MALTSDKEFQREIADDPLQHAGCIVVRLDPSGRVRSLNRYASRFFGVDADPPGNKTFFGDLAPVKNAVGRRQAELFDAYLKDPERVGAFECDVFSKDGAVIPITFAASIQYDAGGEFHEVVWVGIHRRTGSPHGAADHEAPDLFESFLKSFGLSEDFQHAGLENQDPCFGGEKDAEQAIAEKEREFRFCLDNAQVLLTVTDESGGICQINEAGANFFGLTPGEMVGRVFTEFIPEYERERVIRAFRRDFKQAMAKKEMRTVGMGGMINKITSRDGLRDILFYKTGIKVYKNGVFEGILNTAVDITNIVRAREELTRHQEQLEQLVAERSAELQGLQEEQLRRERLTALGKMADVVSQEIRTPLSTISNSLFVIQERLRNRGLGVQRALERAGRAIRRCYSIVYEFKEFTHNDELRKVPVDIDRWLGELIDEITQRETIPINRKLQSGVTAEIDPDRMKRAVLSMVENGCQALSAVEEGEILIRSKLSFNRLEIEVTDNGPGIPNDTLETIFDPLFSKRSFGLGLGMSICRQILTAHGGGVSIESEEKKGTTVLLWIPVGNTVKQGGH